MKATKFVIGIGVALFLVYSAGARVLSAPPKPVAPKLLVVVDANNNLVGEFAGIDDDLSFARVVISTSAGDVGLRAYGDHLATLGSDSPDPYNLLSEVFFLEENCAGTPYIQQYPEGGTMLRSAVVFQPTRHLYAATTDVPVPVSGASVLDRVLGTCSNDRHIKGLLLPAVELGDIDALYPPPYALARR